MSLFSVAHASALISAFSVDLSAVQVSFAPRNQAWRTKKLSPLKSLTMIQEREDRFRGRRQRLKDGHEGKKEEETKEAMMSGF